MVAPLTIAARSTEVPGGGEADRKWAQARAGPALQARPGRCAASPLDQDGVGVRRAVRYYLRRGDRSPYERHVLPWQGQARHRRSAVDEGGQLLCAHWEHGILVGRGGGERGVVEDEGPAGGGSHESACARIHWPAALASYDDTYMAKDVWMGTIYGSHNSH